MAFSRPDDTQAAPVEPDDAPEGLAFATFAAGCFWGVEDFFLHVPGVVDAVSGYTGRDRLGTDVWPGLRRQDGPRRGRARDLRPASRLLRKASRGVLQASRSDDAEPPGPGRWNPVQVGDIHPRRQTRSVSPRNPSMPSRRASLVR